ncbi:DUF3592 domain-containing protein [Geomonas ferrireducens]|uniref:DUF3592 domain-containing protein n=1 Tax=Geomonas ferrireducens TaxID=2570227 RepID=UPI0010A7FCD7|nr:DUF3592 domain-containing protein [Geomonas ferrireducens]
MKEQPMALKVFICLFCTVFIAIGLYTGSKVTMRLARNIELVNSGNKTQGYIVDYKHTRGKNPQTWPVVTFITTTGETVIFESLYHSRACGYSLGSTVPVVYDGQEPKKAEINESASLWRGITFHYLFAAAFAAFGGGIIFLVVKSKGGSP